MNCPACKPRQTLRLEAAPGSARLHHCPGCGGRWIRSSDYWRWRARGVREDDDPSEVPTTIPAEVEQPGVRFCPDDGYLLARYQVGARHSFTIDQCRNCAGAWFDAGEWEALVEGGLADRLHVILSDEWQDGLRRVLRESKEQEQWLRQLGEADLARIRDIKAWLDEHPKRSELYAYLRFHERAV